MDSVVTRGLALGNVARFREIHNSYGDPNREDQISNYHFASYILKDGHIWELASLKLDPVKHIPIYGDDENWLKEYIQVLKEEEVQNESRFITAREYPLPFITNLAGSAVASQMVLTEFQHEDEQVGTDTVTRDRQRKSPDAETRSAAPLTGRQNSRKRDCHALDDEIVEAARQKIAKQ